MNTLRFYHLLISYLMEFQLSLSNTGIDDTNPNISQDLINLYMSELDKTGVSCVCSTKCLQNNKSLKQCEYCTEKENIDHRYKSCQPLYQQWNLPSQNKTLGVFINLKCGHRGSYSDKERDVLKFWLKQTNFINEDPEFNQSEYKNGSSNSHNEEEKSFKDLMDTPNKKDTDVPQRKSLN